MNGILTISLSILFFAGNIVQAQSKPNIIYIMVDDMGYGDLSSYGNQTIATPNIDRMASNGIKFMQAYAGAPVCTPSRAAFMTGRYPARTPVGLREPLDHIKADSLVGLSAATPSVSGLLKNNGYNTFLIGKWHLGFLPEFSPNSNGFDNFYGYHGGGIDYISHTDPAGNIDLYDNGKPVYQKGYLTDLFAQKAVEILKMKHDKPFFLSLQFNAPHWPWQGPNDKVYPLGDKESKMGGSIAVYKTMVERLDMAIGSILKVLKEQGLEKNTLVVFTSDNGGERYSDMGGLKEKKFVLWEGGIRVPAIMYWPGKIPAGVNSEQPIINMDFTATFLALAKVNTSNKPALDGVDIMPLLTNTAKPISRTFFWRVFQRNQQQAIREGDWKYLKTEKAEYLFNVAKDKFENNDLKASYPDRFKLLKQKFADWEKTVLNPVPLPGKN